MTMMAERIEQALLLADRIRTAPRIEISHPAHDDVGIIGPEMRQIIADALEEWAHRQRSMTTVRGRRYDD
jgi:hypothetical protein